MDPGTGTPQRDGPAAVDWAALGAGIGASPLFYVSAGALLAAAVVRGAADSAAVVVFIAALPVVGLTILKNLAAGASLRARLDTDLPALVEAVARRLWAETQARQTHPYYGPGRAGLLFPAPPHLGGSLPGDTGFDPLGIGRSTDEPPPPPLRTLDDCRAEMGRRRVALGLEAAPGAADARTWLERLLDYEVLHGRWAMLAVVGCLLPEALEIFTGGEVAFGEAVWWRVGASKVSGVAAQLDYLGIPGLRIAGGQGVAIIALCQFFLMGGPEFARYVGLRGLEPVGICLDGTDRTYPGGALFDPLRLSADPGAHLTQRVAEVKHGRLAMLAMLGFAAQAAVTHAGPVRNLVDFLADPAANNLFAALR